MADETIYGSRRDRRRAQRKSRIRHNAASAGRGSAVAMTAFGLILTGSVAANASAGGPEQDVQSEIVQPAAAEFNVERASSNSPVAQSAQQVETPPSQQSVQSPEQQSGMGITPASSKGASPASNDSNSSVVGAAYSGEGSPYSWGGTTPAGFDCSGFINWAYEKAGNDGLPRTTHEMEATLPEVSTPEPGDIVLANNSSHGGIYVGDGQVISATTTNGVTVHGMDEPWHEVNAIVSPN